MKKAFTFLFFLVMGMTAYSQIVINEINYNPPEAGTDSLEFVELHNSGGSMVDITGWTISGVTDTFPGSTTIPAGGYFVLAVNSDAMTNVFGVSTRQWMSGGLSNGGESLVLRDGAGMVMDSVAYDDANGWDILPDGNGPSLELCLTADDNNIAENWGASTNATGVIINNMEVKATPGAANTVACPPSADHFVTVQSNFFSPADITINVGESVQWDNLGGTHNVNGTTATYPSNPEGFTSGGASGAAWSYSYTFNTAGLYNYRCDPHFGLGMTGTVTVVEPSVADLVITEIMYNNPGNDDFEYIEIYNNGSEAENLNGYLFSAGVTHTFGDVTIDAGAYLVVALSSDNMLNNFGVIAEQWNSGGLGNGGELITLVDANGNVVDEVDYDDGNGWPEICDGEGPSIILCDVDSDNNVAANWSFSTTNSGVDYGFLGNTIFASPGFANSSCAAAPYIYVDGTAITVNEGDGTAFVGVNMANVNAMDTTDVTFMVMGASTATDTDDYSIANLTVGIGGGGIGSMTSGSLVIDIVDDAIEEGSETIELTIAMATNGVVVATSDFTLTIADNDGLVYPEYDISTVTTNDVDGVADSIGIIAQLQGIVHGNDFNGGGSIQFTMIDATGGIGLFSGNDFGYTVAEGDEVIVQGAISQFNGLTQITPDTVWMVSANNTLVVPPVVTALDETTESELIRINGVSIVDPSDWTGAGSGFNVEITDGTNSYTMRIDNDVDLYSEPAPVGTFDVIGIGGQFDSSVPHNSGYQILPRYIPDIIQDPNQGLIAVDDMVSTDINAAINIEVLNNDNTPNGITSLVIDQDAANGMTNIEADNSITYTPNMDYCGPDNFTYIICDNTAACDTATVTIDVICPSVYTQYPIGQVTTIDQNGVADSLGVLVELTGIVYGVDLQGNDNILFTMIDKDDPNAGLSTFSSNDFGYTVNEGDELIVRGAITQFNGLTQVTADTLWMVSSGNSLHAPEVVTGLGEATESKLIKFENMSFVDPADWDGTGSSFNIDITDGVNTIAMRIDNDVDLANMVVPPFATFNVTGIGGQFDSSDPFDSGYQLLPRYMEDIEEVLSVVDPTISEKVNFYPNPVHETLFVNMTERMDLLTISNILGQQLITVDSPENSERIQVAQLPEGIYILTFVNGDRIWSTEFVKQ